MPSKKKKKKDWKNKYDFSLEWWLVEKKSYSDLKRNPTAVIYARVSDIKQVMDGNWLESQEAKCRDWAKANNVTVLKMFSDEWISWANMQREGIEAAINFLTEQSKQREEIWKKIEKRNKDIDRLLFEKEKINEQKRNISDYYTNKYEIYSDKIDNILYKKDFDNNVIKQIHMMSSTDHALAGLGQNLKWVKYLFYLISIYIVFWGFII